MLRFPSTASLFVQSRAFTANPATSRSFAQARVTEMQGKFRILQMIVLEGGAI
jgi:hypothetical protein